MTERLSQAKRPWDFARKAGLTVLDQAVVSMVSMLIGFAFMLADQPAEYGVFAALTSWFYFFAAVQNATVNTPLVVLASRVPDADQEKFQLSMLRLAVIGGAVLVALASAGDAVYAWSTKGSLAVPLGLTLIIPVLWRDFLRAKEFASHNPSAALRRDVVYSAVACLAVIALLSAGRLTGLAAFVAFCAPALLVGLGPALRVMTARAQRGTLMEGLRYSLPIARWSLPSALAFWLQTSGYVYIPLLLLDTRAAGVVAGTRLLFAPVTLFMQSWPNFIRPLVSRRMVNGHHAGLGSLLLVSSLGQLVAIAAYAVLCWSGIRLFGRVLHKDFFATSGSQVALWTVVFAVQAVRSNVTAFLQSSLDFARLALNGLIAACGTIVVGVIGTQLYGAQGSILGLVVGEAIMLVLLSAQARSMLRNLTPALDLSIQT